MLESRGESEKVAKSCFGYNHACGEENGGSGTLFNAHRSQKKKKKEKGEREQNVKPKAVFLF